MAKTIHVWSDPGTNPTFPYGAKQVAARDIQEGLRAAAPDDTVLVHGIRNDGSRCVYRENVAVPVAGIRIEGVDMPVIDGMGAGTCVTFKPQETALTTVHGFEIRNGAALRGGGVFALDATVAISWCCIHENSARRGGGVCIAFRVEGRYTGTVTNCRVYENHAGIGGGIAGFGTFFPARGPVREGRPPLPGGWRERIRDAADPVSVPTLSGPYELTIADNEIADNVAQGVQNAGGRGGGVSIYRMKARVERNEIRGNRCTSTSRFQGGGVAVYNVHEAETDVPGFEALLASDACRPDPAQVVLEKNRIHSNRSTRAGGALCATFGAGLYSKENIVVANAARGAGGGVAVNGASLFTANRTRIQYNRSRSRGAGLHVRCMSHAGLKDSLVGRNWTGENGGGIALQNATARLQGTHLRQNQAPGGLGGGLFVKASGSGPLAKQNTCLASTGLALANCLVESNSCRLPGGGLYAQLSSDGSIRVDSCVVRKNQSGSDGPGLFVVGQRGLITVGGSLLASHLRGAALTVSGAFNPWDITARIRLELDDNVVRRNATGVALAMVQGHVSENLFRRNAVHVASYINAAVRISNNDFEGPAVVALRAFQPLTGSLTLNNLSGNQRYGVNSEGHEVQAPRNWWDDPDGPTLPVPGSPRQGERISAGVAAPEWLDEAVATTPPTPPRPPGWERPTFRFPDVPDCEGAGEGGGVPNGFLPPEDEDDGMGHAPGGTGSPDAPNDPGPDGDDDDTDADQPDGNGNHDHDDGDGNHGDGTDDDGDAGAGLPRTPKGTRLVERDGAFDALELADGSTVRAAVLPSGAALVLRDDGSVRAFVRPDGSWTSGPEPPLERDPGTPDPLPDGLTGVDDRLPEVRPPAAWRRVPGSGTVRTAVDVDFELDGADLFELSAELLRPADGRVARVSVDGWPLLELRPVGELDDASLDLSDVRILVSRDQRTVAVRVPERLRSRWKTTLRVPLGGAEGRTRVFAVRLDRDPGRKMAASLDDLDSAYVHAGDPEDREAGFRLEGPPATPTEVLVVEDFAGANVEVEALELVEE